MKNLFYELQDVKFIKCFWIHLKCVSAFWMFFKMLIPPHLSPNVWDVFVSCKSILQIDLWGAIEHMTEISAFQISDGIRFYILWFWNTHEEKSCHLGLKLEEVCRRPQDGKVEMRGKQKNHWLNENITVCSLRSKQQPWRGGNSQTGRNCPSPCHGQWAGSPPPFPDTSLLLTSCRSFSRSGIFSLCASVPYSHCSLSQAVPISSQGYCMKRIHSLRPNSSITYPPWFLVFHFRPHWFSLWWHFHDSPFWLQAAPLSATLMKLKSPKSPT